MSFSDYFPFYEKLGESEKTLLLESSSKRKVPKGTVLHRGENDCLGLLLVRSGQLRAYLTSDEGREVTLYRLFERDICLFSASCLMNSIQFDITITAEKETEFWIIPPDIYKHLMENSAPVANYTNEILSSRFSDVMWLIEQIMWKSFDKRLARFLLDETAIEETPLLHITHEAIAGHLGTAREVVTRMLKYFQSENMVKLSRGTVEITDEKALRRLENA